MVGRMYFRMVQEITPAAFKRSVDSELEVLQDDGSEIVSVEFRPWMLNEDSSGYEAFILYRARE